MIQQILSEAERDHEIGADYAGIHCVRRHDSASRPTLFANHPVTNTSYKKPIPRQTCFETRLPKTE